MYQTTHGPQLDELKRSWRLTRGLCVMLLLAIVAAAAFTQRSVSLLSEASEVTTQALLVDNAIINLKSEMLSAESGRLGYLLSGRANHLQPYYAALTRLQDSRRTLELALNHEPSAAQFGVLNKAIAAKLEELDRSVRLKTKGNSDEAVVLLLTDSGKQTLDAVLDALRVLAADEDRRTHQSRARQARDIRDSYWMLGASLALTLLVFAALAQRLLRAATQVHAVRSAMERSIDELSRSLESATEKNEQVHGLSELSRFLQSCVDMDEAVRLLKQQLPLLMRAESGALYLMDASRDQLRQAFAWGGEPYAEFFGPSDCWAVRLGKPFRQPMQAGAAACAHLQSEHPRVRSDIYCLPLVTHGESMGLLVLDAGIGNDERANTENERHRRVILEEVGLSIGLLKLRESLRQQSIRDPLTGLYNRRFLEESAQREVTRATRQQAQGSGDGTAILMIDIDHFKRFNDQHGHEVGDQVLRGVAHVLQHQARGSDVAARYGGEEFTLVLAGVPPDLALKRAEQLRAEVEALTFKALGKVVGAVTVSVGVAQFPLHGTTVEALLLAADKALYEAKCTGRNRVAVAGQERGCSVIRNPRLTSA